MKDRSGERMLVEKRNGKSVKFNKKKIINAISKAGYVDDETKKNIALYVESITRDLDVVTVEQIQDLVEKQLMILNYQDVAKEYIRYRYKREIIRETEKTNNSVLEIIAVKNEEVNSENSNKNSTILSTQRDYMAGEVSKDISKRLLLPPEIVEAHDKGIIHFHDMDYFAQTMHNCCLVNLEDMLQNGTVITNTLIEKPHSFLTACNIATQIMAQVASNQYGGQSASLAHLAPFVDISRQKIRESVVEEFTEVYKKTRYNKKKYERLVNMITERRLRAEVKHGVQIIQYQIMTLMTTNGQAPFVTLWMYLGEVEEGQTREDLALIIEEVLIQRIQGVKNEVGAWVTPSFPKLVYALEKDNIGEDSKYYYLTELAAKCTAKRMVPDYVSEKKLLEYKYPLSKLYPIIERRDRWGDESIWGVNPFKSMSDEECEILQNYVAISDNCKVSATALRIIEKYHLKKRDYLPQAYPPMGCRSFLTPDLIHYKRYGRMNQGVVTINLVDVALSALHHQEGDPTGEDEWDAFWRIFEDRLELCHRGLQIRHQRLLGAPSDVSPIHWQHGALARLKKGDTIDKLLYDGYSTISLGYAGLYECVYAMTGKSHTDESAKPFALAIMQKMNDKCNEWKLVENIDYSLYGTPIESTTYKFAKLLKDRFGVIEGVTDHDYITNSYHVNVREHIDPFTKLKFEAEFQHLSPGGAISYIETSNLTSNITAVLEVIKYIYDNILYAELNTKSDYCQVCGYSGEIQIVSDDNGKLLWQCPNCNNRDQHKMNVARRTCGYIGSQYWNQGRTEEIKDRYVHLGGDN